MASPPSPNRAAPCTSTTSRCEPCTVRPRFERLADCATTTLDCLQVVPTMYVTLDGEQSSAHQFSVTRQKKVIRAGMGDGLPGIFVQYDFSPLLVKYTQVQT